MKRFDDSGMNNIMARKEIITEPNLATIIEILMKPREGSLVQLGDGGSKGQKHTEVQWSYH